MPQDKNIKLLNIVAFYELMNNGEGIISKSPDYIMEKFERYVMSEREEAEIYWGLDDVRKVSVALWAAKWRIKVPPLKLHPHHTEIKKDEST